MAMFFGGVARAAAMAAETCPMKEAGFGRLLHAASRMTRGDYSCCMYM
jgi:hypothetical protein